MGKSENIRARYEQEIEELYRSKAMFAKYLDFSGRFYKMPSAQVISLFEDNPNASMVADYDTWRKFGRRIKTNGWSTDVLVNGSVKRLFDIEQTAGEKIPYQWSLDRTVSEEFIMQTARTANRTMTGVTACVNYLTENAVNERFEDISAALGISDENAEDFRKSLTSMVRRVAAARCEWKSSFYYGGEQSRKDELTSDFTALDMLRNSDEMEELLEQVQLTARGVLLSMEKSINNIIYERGMQNDRRVERINESRSGGVPARNTENLERGGTAVLSDNNDAPEQAVRIGRNDIRVSRDNDLGADGRGTGVDAGADQPLGTGVAEVYDRELSAGHSEVTGSAAVGTDTAQDRPRSDRDNGQDARGISENESAPDNGERDILGERAADGNGRTDNGDSERAENGFVSEKSKQNNTTAEVNAPAVSASEMYERERIERMLRIYLSVNADENPVYPRISEELKTDKSIIDEIYKDLFALAYDEKILIEDISEDDIAEVISGVVEGRAAEIEKISIPDDLEKYYVNAENENVLQVYYNPDSSAGGQFVYNYFSFDDIFTAFEDSDPLEYLETNCRQELIDKGTDEFDSAVESFLHGKADFTNRDEDYLDKLNSLTEPTYEIFQLKKGEALHYHRFTSLLDLTKHDLKIERENYDSVYRGRLRAGETLENIYTRFNIDRPADFTGHSLSVSDIICIKENGVVKTNYVDDIGYKEVPEFLLTREEREMPLEKAKQLIREYVRVEFEDNPEFDDMSSIPLAFTTDAETELPINVFADLVNFRIVKEYGGETVSEQKYDSLENMFGALGNLEFDELVAVGNDQDRAIGFGKGIFTEQELLGILNYYDNISTPKEVVADYFIHNENPADRAEYMRSIHNDVFTELIINNERYGYRADFMGNDGLLVWKGGFLSTENSEKEIISWDRVQQLTAKLIAERKFLGEQEIIGLQKFIDDYNSHEAQTVDDVSPFTPEEQYIREYRRGLNNTLMSEAIKFDEGFVDGKFGVERFYQQNKDKIKVFGDFIATGYAAVEASGSANNIPYWKLTNKGIDAEVKLENGETTSWHIGFYVIARRIGEMIENKTYITQEDIDKRIENAKNSIKQHGEDSEEYKRAVEILADYNIAVPLQQENVDWSAFTQADYNNIIFALSDLDVSDRVAVIPLKSPELKDEYEVVVDVVNFGGDIAAEFDLWDKINQEHLGTGGFYIEDLPDDIEKFKAYVEQRIAKTLNIIHKQRFEYSGQDNIDWSVFEEAKFYDVIKNDISQKITKDTLDYTNTFTLYPKNAELSDFTLEINVKLIGGKWAVDYAMWDKVEEKYYNLGGYLGADNLPDYEQFKSDIEADLLDDIPYILGNIFEREAKKQDTPEHKPASEIKAGDTFLYRGNTVTVTEDNGIYKDDIVISHEEKAGGAAFAVTENVNAEKFAREAIFQPPQEQNITEEISAETQDAPLLNLFGEPMEQTPEKTIIDGMDVDEVLNQELINHGSPFEDGKFRIEKYYKENSPKNADFAKFLSKEFGIGGRSGDGNIDFVNHNMFGFNGITITVKLSDGTRTDLKWNWNKIAKRIAELIDSGRYITQKDIDRRIKHAESDILNWDKDSPRYNMAVEILKEYGLFEEKNIPETVRAFKEKTEKLFKPIGSVKAADIEADVKAYAEEKFSDNEIYAEVIDAAVVGSRSRGIEGENSDLDVVIEIKSDIKEYTLFDILNEEGYEIGGVKVDINPIRAEETGTLTTYLERAEKYLDEKIAERNTQNQPDETENFLSEIDPAEIRAGLNSPEQQQRISEMLSQAEKAYDEYENEQRSLFDLDAEEKPNEDIKLETVVIDLSPKEEVPEITVEKHDFTITDEHLGEGGQKSKFAANIAAIQTLKTIEAENRLATPEEQETLSRYVGWGGIPQVFDEDNSQWATEYKQLRDLLTPDEYEAAKGTVLNAHYTTPVVIDAVYKALEGFGFKGGNVLEPAMGIGNFFGSMPENMRNKSRLHGVEIDEITGRIAKQLYQNADIQICGYENTMFSDNIFDVAIGNVPFGNYRVADTKFNRENFLIHDYFFAKTLDKVAPNGIIAFITSKGTLDKESPKVREYLAKRTDLIGAIRLPGGKDGAFFKNANTEVTTDIIFLQKREKMAVEMPDWCYIAENEDGLPLNQYYIDNPEMMLGKMQTYKNMYGNDSETACIPFEGADLKAQLDLAVSRLQRNIITARREQKQNEERGVIPATADVRNFTFGIVGDKVYFRENNIMTETEYKGKKLENLRALISLRNTFREIVDAQAEGCSDEKLNALQARLNTEYDGFVLNFGYLNSKTNRDIFAVDDDYNSLCGGLEIINAETKEITKADIFSKRTIKPYVELSHVDTPQEALTVSLDMRGEVDIDYMSNLCDMTKDEVINDLTECNLIFKNPVTEKYEEAAEYLSGNVREKLRTAKVFAEGAPEYERNVAALEKAQPPKLGAGDISVRIGVPWVDIKDYCEFFNKYARGCLSEGSWRSRETVLYRSVTGEYKIDNKTLDKSVTTCSTFGTKRLSSYAIFERLLNNRDATVYDTEIQNGKEKRVMNETETQLAQEKARMMKEAFPKWLWDDPDRREKYVERYNDLFNATVGREYDGSHQIFPGMSPFIKLNDHQKNAVMRAKLGGNTLLAHTVGAGKSFEMAAAVMEKRRLGLINKACVVVPKHLVSQMSAEWLRLYPEARLLTARDNDFNVVNRQKFIGRICTGDYDAVIMSYQQFQKIPMSVEYQRDFLRKELHELSEGLARLNADYPSASEKRSIKDLMRAKKSIEAKLKRLLDSPHDNSLTFEQLGFDSLVVDESHNYKNGLVVTKMQNVAGVATKAAKKSEDFLMKTQYLNERYDEKNIILASGTPIATLEQHEKADYRAFPQKRKNPRPI